MQKHCMAQSTLIYVNLFPATLMKAEYELWVDEMALFQT